MKEANSPLITYINDYLDWLDVEKGLSSKTQKNYSQFLKRFTDWLVGKNLSDIKPHEITPELIFEYRIFLARNTKAKNTKENLTKSTQSYYLIVLRSFLSFFTERNITSLPPDKIKLPRDKKDKEIRFLSLEQVKRLFAIPDITNSIGLRDRAIFETLFSTGMRISELTALNVEQVKSSLDKDELELGIVGKGGKARVVYFSSRCLNWLSKYMKTRTDQHSPVFINYRRKKGASVRLTPRSIENIIKKTAILAGLPENTTPHVLRHTFATDLLSKGVDIRILQEFLGHKSITATQIYAHVTSKKLRDVHKKFHGGDELN